MSKSIAKIKIDGVIEKEGETYNQKWLLETIEKLRWRFKIKIIKKLTLSIKES